MTPEYNYGMPGSLKNALDYLSAEWAWKPIGFVSYGNTSAGTRSVQHAKQVVTTLRLVPLGATVAIRIGDAVEHGVLRPEIRRDGAAASMLDELVRLANALRPMRERARPEAVPGPVLGSYARTLTPEDAAEVTVLQRCCWTEEAIVNATLDIPALHESLADVRSWLGEWDATGLLLDGRLLGMVRTRRSGTAWEIGRLAVAPDLRGHGLGGWLLDLAESAAAPGCDRLLLHTGAKSLRNIDFYKNRGYLPTAHGDGVTTLVKDLAR
nr:hypothetical protein GCM10025732_45410 [Glycomyces mayteni]